MAFTTILEQFADAVAAHDSPGLAALFAPDGCYDDFFFGPHTGREAIAAMLDRFFVGGESFCWQFTDPAQSGDMAYASYAFSYLSREPESPGKLIVFHGVGRFRLNGGLIQHYSEVFDRGIAFSQLGYAPARIVKLAERYAAAQTRTPAHERHLAWRAARQPLD